MRGLDVDPPSGLRAHPAAENATAGKDKGVHAIPLDDGQFKIAFERRARYGLPLHGNLMRRRQRARFDLDHFVGGGGSAGGQCKFQETWNRATPPAEACAASEGGRVGVMA
jgi:hypothetical protein